MTEGWTLHSTLERQLRRLKISNDGTSLPSLEQWTALLQRVSRAYTEADDGRYTLERSIDLSSAEMYELHAKLASERDRLRALIGCLGDGLLVVDGDGIVQLANDEAGRLIGEPSSKLVARPLDEVVRSPAADPSFRDYVARGACRNEETSFLNANGATVEVAITVNPVVEEGTSRGATIIFRDVSARKQLEASLRHAQKLESVGRLAAGVAHEINTPIQFINDNVLFLKRSFETLLSFVDQLKELAGESTEAAEDEADWSYLSAEIPGSIVQTLDGLQRVAVIIKSMKNFAHNDRGLQKVTDLNAALENTLVVAGHELRGVAVSTTDFGDIPHVVCCAGDIHQVFLNLVVNAAHAVADVANRTGQPGRITLTTRRDGDSVLVSIADTGDGIPESVRPHVFDPFFTTKEVGRGSGQGLSLARSLIVNKHGGELTFETAVGVGTTFYVRLPIHLAATEATKGRAA